MIMVKEVWGAWSILVQSKVVNLLWIKKCKFINACKHHRCWILGNMRLRRSTMLRACLKIACVLEVVNIKVMVKASWFTK
jgi:hypothetical protein